MWKNILYSGNDFTSDEKFLKHKFELLNAVLILSVFASILIAFIFNFIGTKQTQSLIITLEILYGFINLMLFFFLRRSKENLNLVIYVSMINLYLLQVVVMIFMIEDSLRESWYFLTIVMSFFLGGRKLGYIMISIVFTTIIIYNFQPFIETGLNVVESVIPILLLLCISIVVNLYERTRENYSKSLKEANLLLQDKIEELNQFNMNLEDRVKQEVKRNRKQELKLFEQSKMVAMGEMIGNIAHQWRQPLSVISTISTGAKLQKEMDVLTNEMFNKDMDIINENAQYLSKTIDDFRNFVKGDRTEKLFNLTDEIKGFLHLVEGSIKNNYIEVNLDLNDDIQIYGYPNELKQCFINIFNNSKDVVKELPEENRFIFIKTSIENEKVIISLKDNGGGVSEDVLPKIFEPYFTTKHQSQGTGLGLNMTYKLIVDGMKGMIEVKNDSFYYKNKDYIGACFRITLPLAQ